jgi:hypothetical protein
MVGSKAGLICMRARRRTCRHTHRHTCSPNSPNTRHELSQTCPRTHSHAPGTQVKAIATHCPTRWAIVVAIISDLLASKEAIKAMCVADDWDEVSVPG